MSSQTENLTTTQPVGLRRAMYKIADLGDIIAAFAVAMMFFITVAAIVMRYFVNMPIRAGDELTGFLVVATVMFGAAGTHLHGHNIRMDIVIDRLPRFWRKCADAIAETAVIIFALCLLTSTWQSVVFAYDFGAYTTGHLEWALWVPLSMLLIGFGLLALTALARIFLILTNEVSE